MAHQGKKRRPRLGRMTITLGVEGLKNLQNPKGIQNLLQIFKIVQKLSQNLPWGLAPSSLAWGGELEGGPCLPRPRSNSKPRWFSSRSLETLTKLIWLENSPTQMKIKFSKTPIYTKIQNKPQNPNCCKQGLEIIYKIILQKLYTKYSQIYNACKIEFSRKSIVNNGNGSMYLRKLEYWPHPLPKLEYHIKITRAQTMLALLHSLWT